MQAIFFAGNVYYFKCKNIRPRFFYCYRFTDIDKMSVHCSVKFLFC